MAHTSTASILFCDLVGSTARFAELGDDEADRFIRSFLDRCRQVVGDHGGTVVKTLGDGLMAVFERRTLDAIETALELHAQVALLDPANPPRLRVGLSVGEVNFDDGDWYGRAVTEASRLCSVAEPGTTLATEVVRTILGSRGQVTYSPAGVRMLKGLPDPVVAVLVQAAPTASAVSPPGDPRTRRRWMLVVGCGVAVAIAATAFSVNSAPTPTSRAAARRTANYQPKFHTRTCPAGVDDPTRTCGVLEVPVDRSHPDASWIEVPVDSWSSIGGANRQVALEIGYAVNDDQSPTRLLGRHIRVGVRGREGTPILNCPEVTRAGIAHLLEPLFGDANVSAHVTALRECRNRWTKQGIDVARFSNHDIALDVQDTIAALRLPPVDLIAGTDQTPAALDLMRDQPQLLRTSTLVNPEAPDMSSGQLVTSFRTAFLAYASLCAQDPRCNDALPNPLASWNALYEKYQASPSLETERLPDGQALPMVIDGDRGATALEVAVGSTPLVPYLHLTLTGDAAAAATGNAYEKSDTSDAVPIGADLSDICNRIAPNDKPIDADQISRYASFRSGRFRLVKESCAAWDVPAAPIHLRSAVASAVPTTIVVGTLSTATNPTAVDSIVRGLDHVVVVQFPTLGFAPMYEAPSCLATIWRSWLEHPTVSPASADIAACVAAAPAVQFIDHL